MLTPYDWQEGIGNRAQYIEGKLAQGIPVLAISLDEGIVIFTYRRQARKIYEIYDRLIFAAIGQQSDVEALRAAAVDFAHQEGYNRSEQDVTIQRVVTALSSPLKKAFSDFSNSPVVARSVFGEINETPDDDLFYVLDFDGDYTTYRRAVAVVGSDAGAERLTEKLLALDAATSAAGIVDTLKDIWLSAFEGDSGDTEDPTTGLFPEAVLLERSAEHENRFRSLTPLSD